VTLEQPLFIDGNNYNGSELRGFLEGLFNEGVMRGNDFKVTPRAAGANMTVEVLAGRIAIQSDTGGGGMYYARSTATEAVSGFTTPGVGLQRIDVVYAQHLSGNLVVGRQAGTAAASPTVPTVPADAVPLARVLLTNSTSSIGAAQLTDVRTWATPQDNVPKAGAQLLGYHLNPPLTFVQYGPTLVLPIGPHPRRIMVTATATARAHIDAGGPLLLESYIDLSIDRGASFTAGPTITAACASTFQDAPFAVQHFVTGIPPTPSVGQNCEVHARVAIRRVNSGNSMDFDRSSLHVDVNPA
jgi:hypothetical protein